MAKKSANQLYAEKHLALTTDWFEGYNNDVFVIKGKGFHFSSLVPEEAWTEAAAYARERLASIKERRDEVKVIKMLHRAMLASALKTRSLSPEPSLGWSLVSPNFKPTTGLSDYRYQRPGYFHRALPQ